VRARLPIFSLCAPTKYNNDINCVFEDSIYLIMRVEEEPNALYAPFFGALGVTSAMALSGEYKRVLWARRVHIQAMGAAYATYKSSEGIAATWTRHPKYGMRALVPVVMAGIISIYGLVVGVVIAGKLSSSHEGYTLYM
jgi:V-type H+-transporting ATPase proteolipid subunit